MGLSALRARERPIEYPKEKTLGDGAVRSSRLRLPECSRARAPVQPPTGAGEGRGIGEEGRGGKGGGGQGEGGRVERWKGGKVERWKGRKVEGRAAVRSDT